MFHAVKMALIAVFLISCVYFIYCLVSPNIYKQNQALQVSSNDRDFEHETELAGDTKPVELYLSNIEGKQIFNNIVSEESAQQDGVLQADTGKDMNLLGIISGDNPQAIIEDKNTQKTYYLNKGQNIREFTLEEIKEGRVILNYKGQKLELYM